MSCSVKMTVENMNVQNVRVDSPGGNNVMTSQNGIQVLSATNDPCNEGIVETKCCHPVCRTPSHLICGIICLVVVSIASISALIILSLASKDEKRVSVSHPLFEGCTSYPSYSQIYQTLAKLHLEFSQTIKLETIGQSYEKRNLTIAHLSNNFDQEKPKIWIQCGAHGREKTTPVTCLSFVYNLAILLTNKSINNHWTVKQGAKKVTNRTCIFETESWMFPQHYQMFPQLSIDRVKFSQYEFIILPLVNPDGYHFAHYQQRNESENNKGGNPWWRKNRNNSTNTHCQMIGVDLNRNYDVGFDLDLDERKDPCSNGYGGEEPFSESETEAIGNKLRGYKGNIAAALDIHSFMPAWLHPTQYKHTHTNHSITTKKVVSRILSLTGAQYQTGAGNSLTYLCSGTFMDWVYEVLGCHHSYTVEIRSPMGSYTDYRSIPTSMKPDAWTYFQPEFISIKQISDEVWVGFLALLEQL